MKLLAVLGAGLIAVTESLRLHRPMPPRMTAGAVGRVGTAGRAGMIVGRVGIAAPAGTVDTAGIEARVGTVVRAGIVAAITDRASCAGGSGLERTGAPLLQHLSLSLNGSSRAGPWDKDLIPRPRFAICATGSRADVVVANPVRS